MRTPAIIVRGVTLPVLGADIAAFASFVRDNSPLLSGQLIDVEFDGVSVNAGVAHGLGRAYRGAILVSQNDRTMHAVAIDPITYATLGDPTTTILFQQQGAATAVTYNFWVF